MLVFLDTNVLAAAFATRGLCADVVRHVLTFQELATSETVLAELDRFLKVKLNVPPESADEVSTFLRSNGVIVHSETQLKLPSLGAADRRIVSEAVSAGAAFLVTGDKALLELGLKSPTRIVSPREFWESVRGGPQPIDR